jgi:hypothetical protein
LRELGPTWRGPPKAAPAALQRSRARERRRCAADAVTPSATYTLEFIGANVTADLEGCGTNSMQIWWAYFWEDSMRDDADDSDYARTE